MKARNFRYIRPASLAQACRILADAGGDAVPVAGGQSLLAGLNMRLSAPKLLVDIGDLKELRGQSHADGVVRLGALTRHGELLSLRSGPQAPAAAGARPRRTSATSRSAIAARSAAAWPMPIRRRNCRPAPWRSARRWCSRGAAGEREVKAEDFFKGLFETDLQSRAS